MRPRKIKQAYVCPDCDELHEGDPAVLQAWKVEDVGDNDLTSTEPEEVEACMTDCEVLVKREDIEIIEAYQCGECETIHADRDEARDCCK